MGRERYREQTIVALIPTRDDLLRHNRIFEVDVAGKLAAFDAPIARHEQPALPYFQEPK